MPPLRSREAQLQKEKLADSYQELLQEFSSKDLRNVGNYSLGRLIGKGSFGKVYLATHKLTNGSKVVLKSSNKDDANLAREIHHHRQFLHPHIVRLYEVIVTENMVWLVLEYCPGDELYNYLLRHGPMPIEKVQKIFAQLVGAVAYIHSKFCVHRDLKLENILLDKHENVKLCDFGFTREYEGKSAHLQTFCGTVCYSAPEMLRGEKYAGEKVDVWSLGIILYALIAGELPFDEDDDQATKQKILTEEPKFTERFTEDAKNLVTSLLSKRPLLRPSLSEVLAHPFLAEHAPAQKAILKLTRPPPFSTPLEKTTLERMRSAGVNTDQVIENVLAQRCDALAGWWALLIEKEERKERRRERKRREREAEAKNLRRLSAASSRLERISAALVEVEEEGHANEPPRSRGRRERRSIPNPALLIPDLPKLPETSNTVVASPDSLPPPPPVEKDAARRSVSSTSNRPIPPPKERRISRSSTLHLSASQPDLRPRSILRRGGQRRRQYPIISQLASLKHWLIESTKRAKSPHSKAFGHAGASFKFLTDKAGGPKNKHADPKQPRQQPAMSTPTNQTFNQSQQTPTQAKRWSTASSLTPSNASYPGAVRPSSISQPPRQFNGNSSHRNSLSPSPLTPRNSYRRSSAGLRGRKSTSSSVSSIRTIHHAHSHSKASSVSSNGLETPKSSSTKIVGRSPHASVKVLPSTPSTSTPFPSGIRLVRGAPVGGSSSSGLHSAFNEAAPTPLMSSPATSLVFARRKRSAFKGPAIHTNLMTPSGGMGTPTVPSASNETSERVGMGARKSQIIQEEEDDCEDGEVEEVETFGPTDEKSSTFAEARSSIDPGDALAETVVALKTDDVVARETTPPSNRVPSSQGREHDDAPTPTPSLLPPVEIDEPLQLAPFQSAATPTTQSDAEANASTLIRPPRSSSLREKKLGTPGSSPQSLRYEDKPLPPVVDDEGRGKDKPVIHHDAKKEEAVKQH
ncbi:hypothetical protein VTO42DRAFT_3954 [Malbranchea cinnamomea]